MSNYNGARKKTYAGNRSAYSQSSETDAKSKKNFTQNSGGDGWGNTHRRSSRSTSEDGWEDSDRRKYSKDDGWGEINRRPSNYTSDDLWGSVPSQPAATENAWVKKSSRKNQKSYTNQGKKQVPLVGLNFAWNDEEYPPLETRLPPVENVWEKRKEKLEGRKAMEPTNQTEEELMIQKAIELSRLEAMEEEERRRNIKDEYELQNKILALNPDLFSEFLTPEELAEANQFIGPEATEYNNLPDAYVEKESVWDYPEPVEQPVQQPQKQSKKSGRKKRNKSQSSTHMVEEISTQNVLSGSLKSDHNKQSECMLPEQKEYQETHDNWSQNSVNKNYHTEAEENESQFVDEHSDYHSDEVKSTTSPEVNNKSKMHKNSQAKISKVIDMFGGWGSKNTQNSIVESSHKEDAFELYDNSSDSVSNDNEIFQDGWENSKEISKIDENLQVPKSSPKSSEAENIPINEKSQSSQNEENSWNSKYSEGNNQYNDESKHSLYSHVESSIAASGTSSFCNAATNSSDTCASYLSKKSIPKDDMNSIVQDYASLTINCSDPSLKENVPVQRRSKDIFSSVAPLLNEDNLNPTTTNLQNSNVDEPQNSSLLVNNQISEREITYSLNNAAPAKFSNSTPNENLADSWNDSKIGFHTSPERHEMNDGLFLPHINEPIKDIPNDHKVNSVNPGIPAPVECETHFPCQPNPVMPNLVNPNFMMGMNPLMMQQMMMLNNPFFLQQLHQMEMYYRTMSMPFTSPLIPPMGMPPLNPALNNLMGNFSNGEPNSNMNPVSEPSVESSPSIPPPCHKFEDKNQRSMPIKSDATLTSEVPNVEFENSWLSGLLSEGAAHMDSYIPPPTLPVTHPLENPHPIPNGENKVDTNIAQDIPQSAYGSEAIPQNSNCDMKSPKQESFDLQYGRTEDITANTRNVSSPKPTVPDKVKASGWGEIDDAPKKNYTSWNDDVDGWADEKVTTSKSMINSSRYASQKQVNTRQPVRQPRQSSHWR